MKAILLSAGQGSRLMPWTSHSPKCLLPVERGRPILEVQLRALASCGIRDVTVMVGYAADTVDSFLASQPVPGVRVRTLYNPFFDCADNLLTCWLARSEMHEEFLLINGDTLFEPGVVRTLLDAPPADLTLAIDVKDDYDEDDMKVRIDRGGHLLRVSKRLDASTADGESIGVMLFRGEGPRIFREELELSARNPDSRESYYLSVVEEMARERDVRTASIQSSWWGEVDTPFDLSAVRRELQACPTLLKKAREFEEDRACA